MWSAALITFLVALFGFSLIAVAFRSKSLSDYKRPRYSMWVAIAFIGISIAIFITFLNYPLLAKPLGLPDLLVTTTVCIAFGLVALSSIREIKKRKSEVRPHP